MSNKTILGQDITITGSLHVNTNFSTNGLTIEGGVSTFGSLPVSPSEAPTADYHLANKKYVDDNSGIIILNNGESITSRDNLNFIGFTLGDDDVGNITSVTHSFGDEFNVDITNINAGDLLQRNSTSDGFDFVSTVTFDEIVRASESGLSTDILMSIFVPAGYKIDAIVIKETSGNDAGNISIGVSDSSDEIVSNFEVLANNEELVPLGKEFFSTTNDTDLYVSSSNWGSGSIQIYLTFKKII